MKLLGIIFIGVYLINKTLPGHLEVQTSYSWAEKNYISLVHCNFITHGKNTFEWLKKNCVSPHVYVIFSIYAMLTWGQTSTPWPMSGQQTPSWWSFNLGAVVKFIVF